MGAKQAEEQQWLRRSRRGWRYFRPRQLVGHPSGMPGWLEEEGEEMGSAADAYRFKLQTVVT